MNLTWFILSDSVCGCIAGSQLHEPGLDPELLYCLCGVLHIHAIFT